MEKKKKVKNMNLYASTPEWDSILVFIMAFVAIRELQTTCMDSNPIKLFSVLLESKF